jgi:hypothetical protein
VPPAARMNAVAAVAATAPPARTSQRGRRPRRGVGTTCAAWGWHHMRGVVGGVRPDDGAQFGEQAVFELGLGHDASIGPERASTSSSSIWRRRAARARCKRTRAVTGRTPRTRRGLAHAQVVECGQLEHAALALGQLRQRGEQTPGARSGIDPRLHALDVVLVEEAATFKACIGAMLADRSAMSRRKHVARNPEQPCGRYATVSAVVRAWARSPPGTHRPSSAARYGSSTRRATNRSTASRARGRSPPASPSRRPMRGSSFGSIPVLGRMVPPRYRRVTPPGPFGPRIHHGREI